MFKKVTFSGTLKYGLEYVLQPLTHFHFMSNLITSELLAFVYNIFPIPSCALNEVTLAVET